MKTGKQYISSSKKPRVEKVLQARNIYRFAYSSARAYVEAMQRQDVNNYENDSYYFRGGSSELIACEQKVAELAGVEKGYLGLTTSGMSAIITAFEIASLKAGDIILYSATGYGQTNNYINEDLRERGIIPIEIDTGDIDAMDATLKDLATKNPDRIKVIFLETIGNGPRVPVLDLKRFLKLEILQELNCLIILDNTLPTNSVLPLASYLKTTSLKVIGLESATKFYLLNQDLGGFFFTYDNELLQNLLKKRKRIGATPGPSLIKTFSALLPKSKEQFDKENKLIMRNTRLLAEACEETNNAGKLFTVGHPNLKNYSGYDYAQKNYPDGSIPVFFITTAGNSFGAEELFYRLEEKGAFEDMIFTESFGFKKTAVSYCTRYGGYIRVAGGMESPRQIKKLANCLQSALSNLETSPNAHYHPGFFSTSLFK